MSQLISYLTSEASDCKKAVSPIIGQSSTTIATGAGCADLLVTGTFIVGSTCDTCDNEVLSTETRTFIVPANSVFPLFGFYSALSVQTINAAGTVTPLVSGEEKIFWSSIFVPSCSTCAILVPA